MPEWTVACSMYLAIPVTNAFLSSKLVLKFGCKEEKDHQVEIRMSGGQRHRGLLVATGTHPPGRAGRMVGARCMAAGQAEAALPGGPRWTAHPPVSLVPPSWRRTQHEATCAVWKEVQGT